MTAGRLPAWLSQKPPAPQAIGEMEGLVSGLGLHTICSSALCPNLGKCFSKGTATFLILGNVCTRNCTFCAVGKGAPPLALDGQEPERVCDAVDRLKITYAVITSVTRDDLKDGGAHQFARTIALLHKKNRTLVEALIPDFAGDLEPLKMVMDAGPEVLNHNVETVPRLYPEVRPMAGYGRSKELLSRVKGTRPETIAKSGLMLGLGETRKEVLAVLADLREAGCDLVTIGQYLQPSPKHHPVVRYVPPEEFAEYQSIGEEMGFAGVASAPLVRSSFEAAAMYENAKSAGCAGKVH